MPEVTAMTESPRRESRDAIVWGVLLVAIGGGAFALQFFPDVGSVVVLAIGLALLVVFAFLRRYAALVPGAIMTGLGAGIFAADIGLFRGVDTGGVIVTGLGMGFITIWVVSSLTNVEGHHPWPLVPGTILTTVGVALVLGGVFEELILLWPLILVGLGVIILARAGSAPRGDPGPR
jgi:hypothetical protein